ncbi:unnamed protein product, partial [Polarella glacialis]
MVSPEGNAQAVSFSVRTFASHLVQKGWCCKCRALDLWFESQLESAFKDYLQPRILKFVGLRCCATLLLSAIGISSSFSTETTRQDLPFTWSKQDARTLYSGTHILQMGMALLIALLSVLPSCCRWLHLFDWELIMTGYAVVYFFCLHMMNYKYAAGLYEDGLKTASLEFTADCAKERLIFEMAVTISAFTVSVPVRCCLAWMVPVAAMISHLGFTYVIGGPNGGDFLIEFAEFVVLCCFSIYGAWQNEQHVRDKWLARRQIQEQAADLADQVAVRSAIELLTGTLSDIVLEINSDMTVKTTGSVMHDSFFGASVGGKKFAELTCPVDRDRFLELLQRASRSHVLESCPMRLVRRGRNFEAQVMAVIVLCKVPFFVVGIMEEHNSPQENAAVDRFSLSFSLEDDNGGKRQAEGQADWMLQGVHNNQASDLRSQGDLSLGLGCMEHWLLDWDDPKFLMVRFQQELCPLSPMRCGCCVVLFYGACIEPDLGVLALVSEFVDGTTLRSAVISRGQPALGMPERWWILLDISKALRFMHCQMPEILHGDLKGCNIMVEYHPIRAKLLDFGLSCLHKEGMQPLGGTSRWRAPELFWSLGRAATPAADVFSFGRVVFLTLTGLIPPTPPLKHANDPNSLLDGAETSEELWAFTWPATAVSSIKQLCESCCSLDASKRWTMVQVQEEVRRQVGTSRSTGIVMCHIPEEPTVEAENSE